MAKDKSTKSKGDDFAKPSEATGGGDGWSLASDDNDGELFLITPLRKQMVTTEKYGEKEVIVCDIVHLNEKKPGKSEEHEEVFVFGAWLQGSLRSYIGDQRVLGRLDKADDKTSGRGYVWKLEDADDDDIEIARAYLASIDPFATKTKPADDDEPVKKSKKAKPADDDEPEPERDDEPVKKKKSKK